MHHPEGGSGMARQAKRLTEAAIKRLPVAPSGKRTEAFDAAQEGLCVRTTDTGSKSFNFYFYQGGKHRRMTLGSWPETSLDAARAEAAKARKLVASGIDPIADRKASKVSTVDAAAELFLARHVRAKNRPRSAAETERKLRVYVLPSWGSRPLESITRRDVATLIGAIAEKHGIVMADRTRAAISTMFNWALSQPEYIDRLVANPVTRGMSPGKAAKRDRVLTPREVALF